MKLYEKILMMIMLIGLIVFAVFMFIPNQTDQTRLGAVISAIITVLIQWVFVVDMVISRRR